MNDATDQIIERMQELTRFIEQAQSEVTQGAVTDLSRLDQEVATLCDQTLKLPAQEALKIQPVMAEMIGKLETLGLALKDFKSNLEEKVTKEKTKS
ncbi:MAG: hypothetical protein MRY79_04240 [Alphaproteobacteria bacterium]|nr:hypothetical protein [Alphaproteobacteria bacterium]